MQRWRVMWWQLGTDHPASWPRGYGYVPGVDWFEAVENGHTLFGCQPNDIVYAYPEIIDES